MISKEERTEMKHINYKDVKAEVSEEEGAKATRMRWLISDKDGVENFAMRLFEVGPGGYTPWHRHDWEHEIFILEGEGIVKGEEGETRFKSGDIFLVLPMEQHQLRNAGEDILRFLCLIPYKNRGK